MHFWLLQLSLDTVELLMPCLGCSGAGESLTGGTAEPGSTTDKFEASWGIRLEMSNLLRVGISIKT